MKNQEELSEDFGKHFKSVEEMESFLKKIYKRGIESMLEGEMEAHLGYPKHQLSKDDNARNGHRNRTLKTEYGELDVQIPRDRSSSYEPVLLPKRSRTSKGVESVVTSLYAKGMSNSDIEEQIRELYGFNVSTSTISLITDKISGDIISWQNRPLESLYLVVWMDAIVFKVRENSRVVNKAIYIAIGLKQDGKKEVLGMWLGKNESAAFWMSVLTDIRTRGVNDILITVTDNLNGFTDTIKNIFPKSSTQICVVHQIRNSAKYVVWKDKKTFTSDMKHIYTAPNEQAAKAAFDDFKQKWNDKYSYAVDAWTRNWAELMVFMDFPVELRKIIYTTNTIESYNRQLRKVTKNRSVFPTVTSLEKLLYLATKNIEEKWKKPIANW